MEIAGKVLRSIGMGDPGVEWATAGGATIALSVAPAELVGDADVGLAVCCWG